MANARSKKTSGPRRIVFLHSSNEMYGADRVLLQVVLSALNVQGSVAPEVWLPDDVTPSEDNVAGHLGAAGVPAIVRRLPILRRRDLRLRRLPRLAFSVVRLWWALVRDRPAVVYLSTSACLLGAVAARLAGVRIVILHNQEIWNGREGRLLGMLANLSTRVICISKATLESMNRRAQHNAVLIPNAVPDAPVALRVEGQDGPVHLLIASRWNSWKGHGTLLHAMDQAENPRGLHLTVLGDAPPVGVGVDVAELVASMRNPASVSIAGQVDDIGPFIDAADFVLMPSDEDEPFGLIAIEAFARGRPVIASSGGGLGDIITDQIDGLLFPNRDVESLAGILAAVSRQFSVQLGVAARSTYERLYSLDSLNSRLDAFWESVLQPHKG